MTLAMQYMSANAGDYSVAASTSGAHPGFMETGAPTHSLGGSLVWYWATGKGADFLRGSYANNALRYAHRGAVERGFMNRVMGSKFMATAEQQSIQGTIERLMASTSPKEQRLAKRIIYGSAKATNATAGQIGANVSGLMKNGVPNAARGSHLAEQFTKQRFKGVRGIGMSSLGFRGTLGMGLHIYNRAMMAQFYNALPVLASSAINVAASYGVSEERKRRQMTGLEMYGRGFSDSQAAATMRQTAIANIQGSQLGLQSALSREAAFMHR